MNNQGAIAGSHEESALSSDLAAQVVELRLELHALRDEVARLDADLDESRRLNLRAAELLDAVYQELEDRHAQG